MSVQRFKEMVRGKFWKRCDGDMIKEIFKIGCFGMKRVEMFFIIFITKLSRGMKLKNRKCVKEVQLYVDIITHFKIGHSKTKWSIHIRSTFSTL